MFFQQNKRVFSYLHCWTLVALTVARIRAKVTTIRSIFLDGIFFNLTSEEYNIH